jgi:hypothetical protein
MPSPDPTPQATAAPETPDAAVGEPAPETPQRTANLDIALWEVDPETEFVYIVVLTAEGNNQPVEFFRSGVPVSGFPLPLTIPGNGPIDVMVYSIEEYGEQVFRYHTTLLND